MARNSTRGIGLGKQVEELRKLVEQHVERTRPPRRVLQAVYPQEATEDEIKAILAKAGAEAGVDDPDSVDWIWHIIVTPQPRVEPPREPVTAPVAARDNALSEPRPPRRPDATVVEEERPFPLEYPRDGSIVTR